MGLYGKRQAAKTGKLHRDREAKDRPAEKEGQSAGRLCCDRAGKGRAGVGGSESVWVKKKAEETAVPILCFCNLFNEFAY